MKMLVRSRSMRLAWQTVSTMAVACTAASGANATIVSFSPGETSFTLAGSVSPLYSSTFQQGSSSSTQTVMQCSSPGKFGGCDGFWSSYDRVTTTTWDRNDFNSLQPDALIGIASSINMMPTMDEAFSNESVNVRYYGVTDFSGRTYSYIPFTPIPTNVTPLANQYLHLKFKVGEAQYLGLAHFNMTTVDTIEYSPVETTSGTTNAVTDVPEPDSWMLLTAGLGLAGAGMLRRRSRLAREGAA